METDEAKALQSKFEEAVGEFKNGLKELGSKTEGVSEIKEKMDRVEKVLKEQEDENQKMMKKFAEAQQVKDMLADAETRIKDLEAAKAQMLNGGGNGSGFEKKQELENEIKELKIFCLTDPHKLTEDTRKYLRSDSGVDGGFLMEESTDSEIIKPVTEISDVRPYARVKTRSALRNNFPIRSSRAQMYMDGENIPPVSSESQYAKRGIQLHRATCRSYATLEALKYGDFDLESEITGDQIEAKAEREGELFISGTGSSQPYGLISRLVSDGKLYASGVADALSVTTILRMPGELKKSYRNAIYAFNNKTLYNIRSLQDPDGRLGWQPGNIAAGIPNQINGKGYAVFDDMDDVAANAYPVFFGDIRRAYTICDGKEMVMKREFNINGGYEFLLYNWFGADVVLPEAGLVMKVATSV